MQRLTIILPTEAKLEEAERLGMFSRWKFYFGEYARHFDIEVYSCDCRDFSDQIPARHRPLPFSLKFLPYGNQVLYNLYLLVRGPWMSPVLRVISASFFVLPLLRCFRKKIVLSYLYDYGTSTRLDFGGIKGLTSGLRERSSVTSAHILTTTTLELREKLRDVYGLEAQIIPNFVDTTRFKPLEKEDYILYAGRIYWHKGVENLIEAFIQISDKFPQLELRFAGTGDVDFYRDKVRALGGKNIRFLGSVDHSQMPDLMNRARIFVLPSLHREGHPKALIEAMASGCICIASDVPGNRDVLQNRKDGLLVPPRDSLALAQALTEILQDPSSAHSLGQNAVRTAQSFSVENTLRKEIYLLKEVISG